MFVIVLNTSILTMGVFFSPQFFPIERTGQTQGQIVLYGSQVETQIFLSSQSLLSPLDYVSFYFCYLIFCSLCVDIFEVIKYIFVLTLLMQQRYFSILPNYNTLNMANNCFQHYFPKAWLQMGVKNRNADANNSIDKRNSSFESEKSNYEKNTMKVFEENILQQMRVLMEILVPLLCYYIS